MISPLEPKWIPVTRWAALAGSWNIQGHSARYEGPGEAPLPHAHGFAICNERFRDGRIRAKVRFEGTDGPLHSASAGIVLGYHSESGGYLVAGLGAFDAAYSI